MKSSRRPKRERYVPSRPDLPTRFESLNGDTLGLILQFVGNKSYRSFGGLNTHCKEIFLISGMAKETFVYGYAPLTVIREKVVNDRLNNGWSVRKGVGKGVVLYNRKDILDWAIQGKNKQLLSRICAVAGEEGRIDIFNEVWENVKDWDDKACIFDIFGSSSHPAACVGNLEVLKWLKTHRVHFNKSMCASEAANKGHLHILQWLKDQHLSLYGDLYTRAIDGDHMHVIKWLREQGVPWQSFTFRNAVKKGNLDILQYLHNEGCPWDSIDHLDSSEPEVADWLRANGYDGLTRIILRQLRILLIEN